MCCVPDCENDAMEASTPSLPIIFTRPSLVPTCAQFVGRTSLHLQGAGGQSGVLDVQRDYYASSLAVTATMVPDRETTASWHTFLVLMQQQRPVCNVAATLRIHLALCEGDDGRSLDAECKWLLTASRRCTGSYAKPSVASGKPL